jgi:hypothetical protein
VKIFLPIYPQSGTFIRKSKRGMPASSCFFTVLKFIFFFFFFGPPTFLLPFKAVDRRHPPAHSFNSLAKRDRIMAIIE